MRFDEKLISEDESFNWYYNTRINKGIFIPNKLYNYLIRQDSIIGDKINNGNKIGDNLIILDRVHDYLIKNKLFKKYKSDFRIWVNTIMQTTADLAQDFKNQKIVEQCEIRYIKYGYRFSEKIFSIKHSLYHNYKIVCLFGIKIKVKC